MEFTLSESRYFWARDYPAFCPTTNLGAGGASAGVDKKNENIPPLLGVV